MKFNPRDFHPATAHTRMTPGKSLRAIREIQEMTQVQLARASGVPQTAISAIEHGRLSMGADRAVKLARALSVHPAVLLFPGWGQAPARVSRRAA